MGFASFVTAPVDSEKPRLDFSFGPVEQWLNPSLFLLFMKNRFLSADNPFVQEFDWTHAATLNLKERKGFFAEFFLKQWDKFCAQEAKLTLKRGNALVQVERISDWMDQWVIFSWAVVRSEEREVVRELAKESQSKLGFLRSGLPAKEIKVEELQGLLYLPDGSRSPMDPAEYAYYDKLLLELTQEVAGGTEELELLEETLPSLKDYKSSASAYDRCFALVARGGFGRRELTFSSDVDLAYLVDPSQCSRLILMVLQELIRRLQELFVEMPLDMASQYFELGEDLSRFAETDALHTIPSILEARVIQGSQKTLKAFQDQMRAMCPQEKMVRYLKSQVGVLHQDRLDELEIKEGRGGLRHMQYANWMVLVLLNPKKTRSLEIAQGLLAMGWITKVEAELLSQGLEFFLDLRNFLGLFERYKPQLTAMGEVQLAKESLKVDRFNDRAAMAYLKLKDRFTTVDQLDRFRLNTVTQLDRIADKIMSRVLDRNIEERLEGFLLVKHLGSNEVQKLLPYSASKKRALGENLSLFLDWDNLYELFLYLAKNGNNLSPQLAEDFSGLLGELWSQRAEIPPGPLKVFIYEFFQAEYTAQAASQMLEIALPLDSEGRARTFLGLFLPEVNQMRYLLRNTEVHQYPLCLHSLKALRQMELEMARFRKREPELWRFLTREDFFALKWSVLFHDLGKINPYKDHEEQGPKLANLMLGRLGFDENSDLLDQIRLLIQHHQSMVRFAKLSTHMDLGILKFFELAQRDPRRLILLYLVNLSDFKSVNDKMAEKAGFLEDFFERTLSILEEFRRRGNQRSLTQITNDFLDRKVEEQKELVVLDLLLRQCCHKSLDEVVLTPLASLAPKAAEGLGKNRKELGSSIHYLNLGELDVKSLEKHYFRFVRLLKDHLNPEERFQLAQPYVSDWDWFFATIPNRYLLSADPQRLARQLIDFDGYNKSALRFSFVKGDAGEYDSFLFYAMNDLSLQAKIAFALNSKGINLEQGKINQVRYAGGQIGIVGFFQGTNSHKAEVTAVELESTIANLVLPDLGRPSWAHKTPSKIQVQYMLEREKGYVVVEREKGRFERVTQEVWAVKVSMLDTTYGYFKIMAALDSLGVMPLQVTVNTVGNQIVDYFYVSTPDRTKLVDQDFETVLGRFLNSEIQSQGI